jgi:hypothetical protein
MRKKEIKELDASLRAHKEAMKRDYKLERVQRNVLKKITYSPEETREGLIHVKTLSKRLRVKIVNLKDLEETK